jgi:hypothetical protein
LLCLKIFIVDGDHVQGWLPPVSVFWNRALYASDMLFVENDFGRYSFGSTTDGFKKEKDVSLTVLIQHDKPVDTSNWLPAPWALSTSRCGSMVQRTPSLDGSYRLPCEGCMNQLATVKSIYPESEYSVTKL